MLQLRIRRLLSAAADFIGPNQDDERVDNKPCEPVPEHLVLRGLDVQNLTGVWPVVYARVDELLDPFACPTVWNPRLRFVIVLAKLVTTDTA